MVDEKKLKNLSSMLNATGALIADLSKKAADLTVETANKIADTSKEVVNSTSEAISAKVEERQEKKNRKLTEKIEKMKVELSDELPMMDPPEMITLPEFERERMSITTQQHEILVELVDHMHRLSTRMDELDRKLKHKVQQHPEPSEPTQADVLMAQAPASPMMNTALSMLGASLAWVMILTGIDSYFNRHEILLAGTYPAEIPIWGLGAGTWIVFLLIQLGKVAPVFKVSKFMLFQTGLAVGITTVMSLLLTNNTIETMSNVWTWGTAIAVAFFVSSSMVAHAWRTTKKFFTPNETIEIIQ